MSTDPKVTEALAVLVSRFQAIPLDEEPRATARHLVHDLIYMGWTRDVAFAAAARFLARGAVAIRISYWLG